MKQRYEQPNPYNLDKQLCARCGTARPTQELNIEGTIHFRRPKECLDRKSCERRKRKLKK